MLYELTEDDWQMAMAADSFDDGHWATVKGGPIQGRLYLTIEACIGLRHGYYVESIRKNGSVVLSRKQDFLGKPGLFDFNDALVRELGFLNWEALLDALPVEREKIFARRQVADSP